MVLERGGDEEAGVARDLLKSLGLLKENCLDHHPLGGKNDFYPSCFLETTSFCLKTVLELPSFSVKHL